MSVSPGEPNGRFASRVGFGASGLGTLYHDVYESESDAVLMAAYEAGLRYFDTAPLYGHGLSELRLGRFLRRVPRSGLTVSTKAGRYMVPPRGEAVDYGNWVAPSPLKPVFDYSYEGTLRSIEQSANRLGITDFDVVYIHDVDRLTHGADFERYFDVAVDGCYRALHDLKKGGHIGAVGVGVNESDIATRFVEACDLDVVMIAGRYTILDRSAASDLLPAIRRRGVDLVVAGIFNSGILAHGSRSAASTYDYGAPPPSVVARAERLEHLCATHAVPIQAAALQWPFRNEAVSAAMIGMSRRERVAQNMEWLRLPIDESFWSALEELESGSD